MEATTSAAWAEGSWVPRLSLITFARSPSSGPWTEPRQRSCPLARREDDPGREVHRPSIIVLSHRFQYLLCHPFSPLGRDLRKRAPKRGAQLTEALPRFPDRAVPRERDRMIRR